jgi:hypothetical protein
MKKGLAEKSANPVSMVGVAGFELATPCTPCKCATRLRYTPKNMIIPVLCMRLIEQFTNFKQFTAQQEQPFGASGFWHHQGHTPALGVGSG